MEGRGPDPTRLIPQPDDGTEEGEEGEGAEEGALNDDQDGGHSQSHHSHAITKLNGLYRCSSRGRPCHYRKALQRSLENRYLFSNLVYVIYSLGMLVVDYGQLGLRINDRLYLGFGIAHFFNAWMYVWSWTDHGWFDWVVLPEYLNVIGALLYLASAMLYPREEASADTFDWYGTLACTIHYIETTAATIEVVAAFGWVLSWYATYKRVPGRGFTLDDPDMWALLTIVPASIIYLVYNIQILLDPAAYRWNRLYYVGDQLYFINSILYTMAALRDDGWFYFMPLAGGWRESDKGREALMRALWPEEDEESKYDEEAPAYPPPVLPGPTAAGSWGDQNLHSLPEYTS